MLLFSILKITGIIVLSVLGVILLLLLLVLFVPYRYRLNGSFHEQTPDGTASVGWLFSAVKLSFAYHKGEPLSLVLSVFGFKIRDFLNKKEKTEKEKLKEKEEKKPEEEKAEEKEPEEKKPEAEAAAETAKKPEAEKTAEEADTTAVAVVSQPEESDQRVQNEEPLELPVPVRTEAGEATRRNRRPRRANPLKRLKAAIQSTAEDFRNAARAVKEKPERLKKLYALWKDDRWKKERELLIRKLIQILKQLRPRKGKGQVRFGTGDPASTGTVMELAVMLYSFWGDSIEVVPEFTESVIDGEVNICGRVFLAVVLEAAARVFFNRRLRKVYRKARKILD